MFESKPKFINRKDIYSHLDDLNGPVNISNGFKNKKEKKKLVENDIISSENIKHQEEKINIINNVEDKNISVLYSTKHKEIDDGDIKWLGDFVSF